VDIYSIGGIFLGGTFFWWWLFRSAPSVWVLIIPWSLFALSFFLAGVTALVSTLSVAHRLMQGAILLYAFSSAAGIFFFSLNFGEEAVSRSAMVLS
jgi:alpha-1,3-glucan synthase